MGKKVVKKRRERGVREFKKDIALIDKKEKEIEKRIGKIPGGRDLLGKKIKKGPKRKKEKRISLKKIPAFKKIKKKSKKAKGIKQPLLKKLRFGIRSKPKTKPVLKKIPAKVKRKIKEKQKKIKKRLFKKLSFRIRSKPKKEALKEIPSPVKPEKKITEEKPKIKKVKKSIFKKIFFKKEKKIEEKKVAKPKIQILKIKAKKVKLIKPKKPLDLKKFSRFLTYLFTALILFFVLYKGITYLSRFFTDQLLFYVMVAVILTTLLIALVHLIVHRRTKKIGALKKIKEELAPKSKEETEKKEKEAEEEGIKPTIRLGKTHKTDIDVLYDLVKKRGHVKVSFLAKTFNVDKKTIEDWAELLEEHELLKIHYPAIGEAELVIPKKAEKKK